MKGSGLNVGSYLVKQRSIGCGPDRSFAQFAMERGQHFGPSVGRARNVVGCRECANLPGARSFVIQAHQIAGIEINHGIWRSRSWLMRSVESVPPRRYLRWARKARVNFGEAKNGLAGKGHAGTIFQGRGRIP